MNMLLAVAGGGAIGAVMRYLMHNLVTSTLGTSYPWATLSINVIGSFLLGVCVILFSSIEGLNQALRVFVMIGLLGAFTTFSTFSLDAFNLWERGEYLSMASYIALSVFCSIAGLFAGIFLMRQIIA